jgi:hypothetical protein
MYRAKPPDGPHPRTRNHPKRTTSRWPLVRRLEDLSREEQAKLETMAQRLWTPGPHERRPAE